MDDKNRQVLLEAWVVSQENARHFNDLLMKIRAGAVVFLGLAISAALASDTLSRYYLGWLALGAAVLVLALYAIDRWYYHILLLGTVTWARAVELTLFGDYRIPGLAQHVADTYQRVSLFSDGKTGKRGRPVKSAVEPSRSATDRVAIFYGIFVVGLIALAGWSLAPSLGWWSHDPKTLATLAGILVVLGFILIERRGAEEDLVAMPPTPPKVLETGGEPALESFDDEDA